MKRLPFDPGFTTKADGRLRRIINPDGSFNVRRVGHRLRDLHVYQILVTMRWLPFLALLLAGYVALNAAFAGLYLAIGIERLQGADAGRPLDAFLSAFYFSTHTFTTVGYGTIAPTGAWANLLASFEAMVGLTCFAVATGLLYGRFSRATSALTFSPQAVIVTHRGGPALMFRVANRRRTTLMELEARLLLATVKKGPAGPTRTYDVLDLEVPSVYFLPLTWTVVHPITATSPLHGKTAADLAALQAEVLVLVKGYDESFRQQVHARNSYRSDEFVWGTRFAPAFHVGADGTMVLDLAKMGALESGKGE